MKRLSHLRVVVIALVALAGVSACGERRDVRPAGETPAPRSANRSALAALNTLAVKGRAPKTGYDREQFGGGWTSIDGCDTHDRILRRDLLRQRSERGDKCEIVSGRLADPYTAAAIGYERGGAVEVDVDHVVALGDAWQKGAQQWTGDERVAFANDPLNLLTVSASANRQKGDGDAATWLPPNKRFRCTYIARQIAVKRRYGAWVTRAERDAMRRVLGACPRTPLPADGAARVPVVTRTPTPAAPPGDGHLANCDAVRAAGRAPLRAGDPAYDANPALDGDRDGVACE